MKNEPKINPQSQNNNSSAGYANPYLYSVRSCNMSKQWPNSSLQQKLLPKPLLWQSNTLMGLGTPAYCDAPRREARQRGGSFNKSVAQKTCNYIIFIVLLILAKISRWPSFFQNDPEGAKNPPKCSPGPPKSSKCSQNRPQMSPEALLGTMLGPSWKKTWFLIQKNSPEAPRSP